MRATSSRAGLGVRPPRAVLVLGIAVALALAASPAAGAHTDYEVRPGDTLEVIARKHGTTVSAIAGENGLADPDRIVAGRVLRLPVGTAAQASGGTGSTGHHVVQPGETLSGIGQRYGVAAARLADWNGLSSVHVVPAGARISVAGPAADNVARSGSGGGGGQHRVAPGETLGGIALRTGVSLTELARANQVADPNRIVAGAVITIPGAGAGWRCPVQGTVSFVNDFGFGKPGGRFHDGVDLYAARGTPVVAPVAGRVEHVTGELAGLQFTLYGVDGNVYVGTHLDSFGASGQVQAGEVLGTVGTTGNARGTPPHLHFEIHADGGTRLVNPYPSLRTACG